MNQNLALSLSPKYTIAGLFDLRNLTLRRLSCPSEHYGKFALNSQD